MIKAVILDFDDTLCLTEEACFSMENEALQSMGRPVMPREVHKANWGKPLFVAIQERSPGIDIDAFRQAYEPINIRYAAEGLLDKIPEENYEVMDELITMGKQLVVLTSREHGELKHLLEPDHLLASRVATFYYKDNMQFHKPDPRAFAHIEHEHGWKPEECVYVGDSVSDAMAANGAGLRLIISLQSGLRDRGEFADYQVDKFIGMFPEIVSAVQSLDR